VLLGAAPNGALGGKAVYASCMRAWLPMCCTVGAACLGCGTSDSKSVKCGPGTSLVDDTCIIDDTGSLDAAPNDVTEEATGESGRSDADVSDAGILDVDGDYVSEADAVPDAPSSCGSVGPLITGTDSLIDVFVIPSGVVVVRNTEVDVIGRDGVVKTTKPWPREITAAAMDGTTLLVADKAAITTVTTPDLVSGLEFFVVETCVTGVVISKSRYICGPANDWDRVFYTYDYKTGTLLAKSSATTYAGIPMRRVPGFDEFITVGSGYRRSTRSTYLAITSSTRRASC